MSVTSLLVRRPGRSGTDALSALREGGVVGVILVLFVLFAAMEPRFAGRENLKAIALQTSIFAVLAAGQTLVVLTRNIDLSVGSTVGLSAIVAAMQIRDHPSMPTLVLILIAVAVGTACGIVNGLLVAVGDVPAIVATLGTLAVYRGVAFVVGGNKSVNGSDIPSRIGDLAVRSPFGLPWLDVIAVVLFVVLGAYLLRTRSGRYFYAVGSDPVAASARGVPYRRTVFAAFVLCGAVAGLCGALFVAKFGSVDPQSSGVGYELWAISAVVVGGTSIMGGTGGVGHTLAGVLLIGVVNNGLQITGLDQAWQTVVQGAIILLAVSADAGIHARFAARRQIDRRQLA